MMDKRLLSFALSGILSVGGLGCHCMGHHGEEGEKAEQKDKQEDKIPVAQVPANVVDGVTKAMADGKITDAEKETKDGKVVYELDVLSGGKTFEVKVGDDGKVLSQKEETEQDEKDEKGEKKD